MKQRAQERNVSWYAVCFFLRDYPKQVVSLAKFVLANMPEFLSCAQRHYRIDVTAFTVERKTGGQASQGASGASSRRTSLGWSSSCDEDERYSGNRFAAPWVSSISLPAPPPDVRIPTTQNVQPPPSISSSPASDAFGSLTGFRRVYGPLRLRTDDAFSSYREDDSKWNDAWRSHQSCSCSRRATLISHLFNDCEPTPEFLERLALIRSAQPAADWKVADLVVEPRTCA